jgi:hypothetical protein
LEERCQVLFGRDLPLSPAPAAGPSYLGSTGFVVPKPSMGHFLSFLANTLLMFEKELLRQCADICHTPPTPVDLRFLIFAEQHCRPD